MSGNLGTARMFERFLLEQKARVPQPPKMRKTFAGPLVNTWGKIDPEREKWQWQVVDQAKNLAREQAPPRDILR